LAWNGCKERRFNSNLLFWLSTRNIKVRYLCCDILSDKTTTEIARIGLYLHWLGINELSQEFSQASDVNLIKLGESCPNLEGLNIAGCDNITDTSLIRVECCPNLLELGIECYHMTDKSLVKIAECCPNIMHLSLSYCPDITDYGMTRIAECCLNILVTYVSGCPNKFKDSFSCNWEIEYGDDDDDDDNNNEDDDNNEDGDDDDDDQDIDI
jgi:hypothetical protein